MEVPAFIRATSFDLDSWVLSMNGNSSSKSAQRDLFTALKVRMSYACVVLSLACSIGVDHNCTVMNRVCRQTGIMRDLETHIGYYDTRNRSMQPLDGLCPWKPPGVACGLVFQSMRLVELSASPAPLL